MSRSNIEKLAKIFSNRSLPKDDWTHQAHLQVAFRYNWNYKFDEALRIVRELIISYNDSVGTVNSSTSGYHETLTVFWMIITRNFLTENEHTSVDEAYEEFLVRSYHLKDLPDLYYSDKVLFSEQARKEWVDGDIKSVLLK
ncbi:MAG: hypothetical protein HKN68_15360 [Saprospiraceae bacterium]|nr:hypothetical protein [Saprospiraceae bacterium]